MVSMTTRKTPRPPTLSFYLGKGDKREERIAKLNTIAEQFNMSRSELLQKIADGDLLVIRKPPSDD